MTLPDVLRWIAIGLLTFSTGMALRIAWPYRRQSFADKPAARLLPRHVISIGVAWAGLSGFAVIEITSRLGEPMTWRPPVGIVVGALACYALGSLSLYLAKHHRGTVGAR